MNKPVQSKARQLLSSIPLNSPNRLLFTKIYRQDKRENHVTLLWQQDLSFKRRHVGKLNILYVSHGKRCLDVFISLIVVTCILSWLVPVIALVIRIDSPGPFFFVQRRTGHLGRPFSCLKFRTMIRNKSVTDFKQTAKNDSRVTKIGKFLRRTNIDELLQFINVLLGHMTLVGPRPHAINHDAMYWHMSSYQARYLVKPGITGLAQIRGARGATEQTKAMNNRIRYDHLYIKNQTLRLDAKIFVKTLWLTISGDPNAW